MLLIILRIDIDHIRPELKIYKMSRLPNMLLINPRFDTNHILNNNYIWWVRVAKYMYTSYNPND